MITDGEQRKPSFATYPVAGLETLAADGVVIPFADGHTRQLPVLTGRAVPLPDARRLVSRRGAAGGDPAGEAGRHLCVGVEPAVPVRRHRRATRAKRFSPISSTRRRPTSAAASRPARTTSRSTSRKRGSRSSSTHRAGCSAIRRPEQPACSTDSRLTSERAASVSIRVPAATMTPLTAPTSITPHLLPLLFELHAGAFYLELAGEADPEAVLETVAANLRPDQRVFVGVTDPIDPAWRRRSRFATASCWRQSTFPSRNSERPTTAASRRLRTTARLHERRPSRRSAPGFRARSSLPSVSASEPTR